MVLMRYCRYADADGAGASSFVSFTRAAGLYHARADNASQPGADCAPRVLDCRGARLIREAISSRRSPPAMMMARLVLAPISSWYSSNLAMIEQELASIFAELNQVTSGAIGHGPNFSSIALIIDFPRL